MSKRIKDGIWTLVWMSPLFAMWYFAGRCGGVGSIRNEAISAGAAEYRLIDPQTGKTEFVWIGKEGETK